MKVQYAICCQKIAVQYAICCQKIAVQYREGMKLEFAKYKCDNCEKIVDVIGNGMPSLWFVFSISEWSGMSGETRLEKDICSESCVFELLRKLKEIPKKQGYFENEH